VDGIVNVKQQIQDNIDAKHWTVITTPVANRPEHYLSYSVGLAHLGFAELIHVGVGPKQALWLLNDVAERERAGALAYGDVHEIIRNAAIRVAPVATETAREYALLACDYADRDGFELRFKEVLVPDEAGRFPGDPHYSLPFRSIGTVR